MTKASQKYLAAYCFSRWSWLGFNMFFLFLECVLILCLKVFLRWKSGHHLLQSASISNLLKSSEKKVPSMWDCIRCMFLKIWGSTLTGRFSKLIIFATQHEDSNILLRWPHSLKMVVLLPYHDMGLCFGAAHHGVCAAFFEPSSFEKKMTQIYFPMILTG